MFIERYIHSVGSSNLRDDERHHACDPLTASAIADRNGAGIGSLLARVKYADGFINREFEGNPANLAELLRLWTAAVRKKGEERKWMNPKTAWDLQAAMTLYQRVAEASLAYWLDDRCQPCGGSGLSSESRYCECCKGKGKAEIAGSGRFETEKIKDMVSELEGLLGSYNRRAAYVLRKTE